MNPQDERYGERPVCSICHKAFKHVYSLNRHVKVVHMNHRPHTCECGKAFATREQLSRHRNSKHSFEKPYKCQKGCDRAFASYPARDFHHRSVHDQQKFYCPVFGCTKFYSSKIHLKNHLAKPHHECMMALQLLNWIYSYGLSYFYSFRGNL